MGIAERLLDTSFEFFAEILNCALQWLNAPGACAQKVLRGRERHSCSDVDIPGWPSPRSSARRIFTLTATRRGMAYAPAAGFAGRTLPGYAPAIPCRFSWSTAIASAVPRQRLLYRCFRTPSAGQDAPRSGSRFRPARLRALNSGHRAYRPRSLRGSRARWCRTVIPTVPDSSRGEAHQLGTRICFSRCSGTTPTRRWRGLPGRCTTFRRYSHRSALPHAGGRREGRLGARVRAAAF